ncbi:MAG: ParA family protein [Caldilineaceae bacterium]
MPIITIASNKGGVAKTTTAIAIAHGLTLYHLQHAQNLAKAQVRLLDTDRQGHCATILGLDPEPGAFDYFISRRPLPDLLRATGRDGLSLLPSNSRTETAERVLMAEGAVTDVQVLLRQLATTVAYLVIDTPPRGFLQEQAIRVADIIICPTRPEHLAVDGLAQTVAMISGLHQESPGHARLCILPTCFDSRLREHIDNWNLLKETWPMQTLNCIPQRIAVAETSSAGLTIWESKARGIEDVQAAYGSLLNWITGEKVWS